MLSLTAPYAQILRRMFAFKTLLVVALTTLYSTAAPAPATPMDELVVLATESTAVGTLTYYGGGNVTATPALSARACGSNDVKCDGSHVPPVNTCVDLINSLRDSTRVLPNSPRSVCLSNGGTCCISWHDVVPNLQAKALYGPAVTAHNTCVYNHLSGSTYNTNLNGVCTRQCLSDRASGC